MKKIIILLFISLQVSSQSINFKGKLLDKLTREPVVYANISFLKINTGISSLEDGTFSLEIDKKLLIEKVHISCLSYKDTIVLAKDMLNKTIYLQPEIFELDEIVISKKVDRELVVDKYSKKEINSGFGSQKKSPWIVTKFFKYDSIYAQTPYLKNVMLHVGKVRRARAGKFRLRFFSVDTLTKKPKKDLLSHEIIINVKKRNELLKFDLSKYDIEIPKEGFFVGFEWLYLPNNFYEIKIRKKNSKKIDYLITSISPFLKGKIEKDKTTWCFSQGEWHKIKFLKKKDETIIPAISLTLTN